jgi:predicted 3-demethylubiquinone-9 3-methyltransferase (glyoxalase superfamily)
MAITPQKITPCLWFDTEAEDAAKFYCSVFDNSRINTVSRYGNEGYEIHGKPAGSVMGVEFELGGQKFSALNGGPQFKFDEAISFQIPCKDQGEVGRSSPPTAARKARAAGSRTNSGSPGRSSRPPSSRC